MAFGCLAGIIQNNRRAFGKIDFCRFSAIAGVVGNHQCAFFRNRHFSGQNANSFLFHNRFNIHYLVRGIKFAECCAVDFGNFFVLVKQSVGSLHKRYCLHKLKLFHKRVDKFLLNFTVTKSHLLQSIVIHVLMLYVKNKGLKSAPLLNKGTSNRVCGRHTLKCSLRHRCRFHPLRRNNPFGFCRAASS